MKKFDGMNFKSISDEKLDKVVGGVREANATKFKRGDIVCANGLDYGVEGTVDSWEMYRGRMYYYLIDCDGTLAPGVDVMREDEPLEFEESRLVLKYG